MNVEQVAAAVRAALDLLPTDLLGQAHARLGEARETLGRAVNGSTQAEARQPLVTLAEAQQTLVGVESLFQRVRDLMGAYLDSITGGSTTATPAAPATAGADPGTGTARPPSTPRVPVDRGPNGERVEHILGELPPQVPRPNPSGKKTHGRILGEDDAEVITSGDDAEATAVAGLLTERGVRSAAMLRVTTHVEMKVAARMIRAGEPHAEVALNNVPCPGAFGCDRLLPVLLPAGYSLTVHGPNYVKTFHGGTKW